MKTTFGFDCADADVAIVHRSDTSKPSQMLRFTVDLLLIITGIGLRLPVALTISSE